MTLPADEAFGAVTERFVREYLERYPHVAAQLGFHEFDGRVTDYRREALDGWVDRLRHYRGEIAAVDRSDLEDDDARMDLDVLRLAVDRELMEHDDLRRYRRNPLDYLDALDLTYYLKREYGPLVTRVQAMVQHLGHVPRVVDQIQENLELPVPEPFLRVSLRMFRGAQAFLENELPVVAGALQESEPDLMQALADGQQAAVEALENFAAFLEGLRDSGEVTGDFAIGSEAFRNMLRTGEGVDLPLERLVEIGEDDLAHNRLAFAAMANAIDPDLTPEEVANGLVRDHPDEDGLLEDVRTMLHELRDWVEEHEIVTVPGGGELKVEETPAFLRWAFAMLSAPGPFEEDGFASYYWVTPPESDWPKERKEQWLGKFAYPKLWDVSIHEAYPGHYVHFLHFRNVQSRVRRIFTAYSFWEAWAHYVEQMTIEAGFRPADLRLRLAQTGEALLRDVRFLVAIRMHTEHMTVEEATRLFMEEAHLSEAPARQEALRGTFDPGYLNYTLGKLMLLKLRDDYKAERKETGEAFSLREFHDQFLSFGAPPVPLVRARMLSQDDGEVL